MKTGFLAAVLACCILLSVPQYASSDTAFDGLWGRAIESINNKTKDGVGSWASAMNWDPQAALEQLKSALDNPNASSADTSDSITKDNSLLEELDKAIKQPMNTALSLIQSLLVDDTKTEKAAAAAGEAKAASASDVLSDIQSYLVNGVSTKDSRQLAAIALLQGYALTSLIKTLKDKGIGIPGIIPSSSVTGGSSSVGSTAALAEMSASAAAATNPLSTTSSSRSGSNRGPIAYPIPEPSFSGFNSLVCMRLSNFASAEGYRSVYFGSKDNCNTSAQHATSSLPSPSSLLFSGFPSLPAAPAGETSSTASVVDEVSWGDQASFTLDCQIKSSSISHSLMQYPSDIAAALGWSSTSSSSLSSSASGLGGMGAAQKQLQCYLSITTDTGSGIAGGGAILQKSIPLSVFTVLGGEVQPDALSLWFCNVMSSPSTTTTSNTATSDENSNNARVPKPWSLNRFKLNGKALPGIGLSYQVPASTRGGGEERCQQMMLHVAPAALQPDKGFTLTGWIDFGGNGGGVKNYGVGRLGSFEVKVGEYKLIDGRKAFAAMMGSGSGVGTVGE